MRSPSETSSCAMRVQISPRSRAATRDCIRIRPPSATVAAMMAMISSVIQRFLSLTHPDSHHTPPRQVHPRNGRSSLPHIPRWTPKKITVPHSSFSLLARRSQEGGLSCPPSSSFRLVGSHSAECKTLRGVGTPSPLGPPPRRAKSTPLPGSVRLSSCQWPLKIAHFWPSKIAHFWPLKIAHFWPLKIAHIAGAPVKGA